MSLHALATDMASKGRNGDSMLVHMTPSEVHGLQALAMKHGGSLTINPDTGLPEANFLKSLLPMIAGFALAPLTAGTSLAFLGATPMAAAMTVGGITGLATGSLQKGLMAGLGAYGGAGLQAGLAGAGASTIGATEAAKGLTMTPELTNELMNAGAGESAAAANNALQQQVAGKMAAATPYENLSSGLDAFKNNPTGMAKSLAMPALAAAAPIVADMMVPTTTKAPSPMAPGRIREKRWNGQYFEDVASTDAGVYNTSGRSFSDLYRGYNNGGIVALAEGGDAIRMAGGTPPKMLTDEQLYQASGLTGQAGWEAAAVARDQQNRGMNIFNDAQNLYKAVGAAPSTQAAVIPGVVDVTKPGQYAEDPTTGKYVSLNVNSLGFDPNNPFTQQSLGELAWRDPNNTTTQRFNEFASQAQKDANAAAWAKEWVRLNGNDVSNGLAGAIADGVMPKTGADAKTIQNALMRASEQSKSGTNVNVNKGLAGLNQNQNLLTNQNQGAGLPGLIPDGASYTNRFFAERGLGFDPIDKSIDNFLATYKTQLASMTPKQQEDAMRGALNVEKMNEADVVKATGMTIAQLVQAKRADGSIIVPGNLDKVPVGSLPGGVSGAGKTVINENGTITTRPDTSLPMKDVRNAYTEGGGSLGYTSPSFDKIEDFNKKYVTDRMSGDSLAAYEYLTGKAGATYPTKSTVGQIARPYDEAVLGYPARGNLPFTYDKATGKMIRNMDYVAPGRDDKGNVTYGMSLNDVKKLLTDTPLSGQALYDWAQTNKVSAQQIADATGRSLSSVYADFRKGSSAAATKDKTVAAGANTANVSGVNFDLTDKTTQPPEDNNGQWSWDAAGKKWVQYGKFAGGGMTGYAMGGLGNLGSYSDGGRLLRGPGDGVSDSIPATIGRKQQPARLADGEFVVPARIVSELGNGSTDAGAKKLYAMMDRVQRARGKTTGKNKVAANSRADKYLPA